MRLLKVSTSTLSHLNCSTRATLSILGRDGLKPSFKPVLGGLMHECMNRWATGVSVESNLDLFESDYTSAKLAGLLYRPGFPEDLDEAWTLPNLRLIVNSFIDHHPIQDLPFTIDPELAEIDFGHPLGEVVLSDGKPALVVVIGRIDLMGEQAGGRVPIEWKFTGQSLSDSLAHSYYLDSQNTAYQWAAREQLGADIGSAYVYVIQVKKVPDSNRKCSKHRTYCIDRGLEPIYANCGPLHCDVRLVPVDRGPEQIEQWARTTLGLATQYGNHILQAREKGLTAAVEAPVEGQFYYRVCTDCEFNTWCGTGKKPHALEIVTGVRKFNNSIERSGLYDE